MYSYSLNIHQVYDISQVILLLTEALLPVKAGESMCDSHNVCVDTSTSDGVSVNTTDQEYPFKVEGASLPPEGINNTERVIALKAAAEQKGHIMTGFKGTVHQY